LRIEQGRSMPKKISERCELLTFNRFFETQCTHVVVLTVYVLVPIFNISF